MRKVKRKHLVKFEEKKVAPINLNTPKILVVEEGKEVLVQKVTLKDVLLLLIILLIVIFLYNTVFTAQVGESLVKTEYQNLLANQMAELYKIHPEMHFRINREYLENLPNKKEWYEIWLEIFKQIFNVFFELVKDFIKNFPRTMNPDYVLEINKEAKEFYNAIKNAKK